MLRGGESERLEAVTLEVREACEEREENLYFLKKYQDRMLRGGESERKEDLNRGDREEGISKDKRKKFSTQRPRRGTKETGNFEEKPEIDFEEQFLPARVKHMDDTRIIKQN